MIGLIFFLAYLGLQLLGLYLRLMWWLCMRVSYLLAGMLCSGCAARAGLHGYTALAAGVLGAGLLWLLLRLAHQAAAEYGETKPLAAYTIRGVELVVVAGGPALVGLGLALTYLPAGMRSTEQYALGAAAGLALGALSYRTHLRQFA